MTPLRPVKFTKTCELQITVIAKIHENAPKEIFDEVHNNLCRLTRPYPDSKRNGITITPIRIQGIRNYFNYKRDNFSFSFDFECPETGYIVIGKIYAKDRSGKFISVD